MKLVSVKILAELLMIKQSTLYSWVNNGSIPFHKLNGLVRFDMDEIESWIKTSRQAEHSSAPAPKKTTNLDIDNIVRNAIADTKDNRYNPSNGKPGRHQGLRKEA